MHFPTHLTYSLAKLLAKKKELEKISQVLDFIDGAEGRT